MPIDYMFLSRVSPYMRIWQGVPVSFFTPSLHVISFHNVRVKLICFSNYGEFKIVKHNVFGKEIPADDIIFYSSKKFKV